MTTVQTTDCPLGNGIFFLLFGANGVTRANSLLIRFWKNLCLNSIGDIVVNFTLFTLLRVGKMSTK